MSEFSITIDTDSWSTPLIHTLIIAYAKACSYYRVK